MSITADDRQRTVDVLTRHYDATGQAQMWIDPDAVADRAWVRYARCGQWNTDAPDPEWFFALRADDPDTYRAQQYCADCPVRRYCWVDSTHVKSYGVRGGVYRNDHGLVTPLCSTIGCLRYRAGGKLFCSRCYDERKAASTAGTAAPDVAAPELEQVPA
jgi:hypothetical protein